MPYYDYINSWWLIIGSVLMTVSSLLFSYRKIKGHEEEVKTKQDDKLSRERDRLRIAELEDSAKFRQTLLETFQVNQKLVADQSVRISVLEQQNRDQATKMNELDVKCSELEIHYKNCQDKLLIAERFVTASKVLSDGATNAR